MIYNNLHNAMKIIINKRNLKKKKKIGKKNQKFKNKNLKQKNN